jgi:isomaltose glucohydrolase
MEGSIVVDLPAVLACSTELILANQAPSGAYVASPTFPTYRYSWFRDGAFIADAMSRAGHVGSAEAFFGWCARIVRSREDRVEQLVTRHLRGERVRADEHLHTRYTLDGDESDEVWENFQLDGYGTWLWALDAHLTRHGLARDRHVAAAELTARYLAAFWSEPSYDWWEEHLEERHTSTLAAIAAGLRAVAGWAEVTADVRGGATGAIDGILTSIAAHGVVGGSLTKWLGSSAVDGSLTACFVPFGLYDPGDPVARSTVARIERELAPAGVYRYLDDVYYGGGQWVLLAGFLGWYHAVAGDRGRAEELLAWMVRQADGHAQLPEQVAVDLLHPEHEAGWIARWGPSARPLLWSHAMLLTLADALGLLLPPTPSAASPLEVMG